MVGTLACVNKLKLLSFLLLKSICLLCSSSRDDAHKL